MGLGKNKVNNQEGPIPVQIFRPFLLLGRIHASPSRWLFFMNASIVFALVDKEDKEKGIDMEKQGSDAHFPGEITKICPRSLFVRFAELKGGEHLPRYSPPGATIPVLLLLDRSSS